MAVEISKEVLEKFDTAEGRKEIIKEYAGNIFVGKNVDGEDITVKVGNERFSVATYQNNGWTMTHEYNNMGQCDTEICEGKWRDKKNEQ